MFQSSKKREMEERKLKMIAKVKNGLSAEYLKHEKELQRKLDEAITNL